MKEPSGPTFGEVNADQEPVWKRVPALVINILEFT